METDILKQWQRDYPQVPDELSSALAALLEKIGQDELDLLEEASARAGGWLAALVPYFTELEQLRLQVEEYRQAQSTAGEFRQALAKELTDRQVPEAFWQAALDVDVLSAELIPSAEAIQAGYKAYLQQQADSKVEQQPRPQQAIQRSGISPAVENFLRSRSGDSPLAGRIKG